MDSTLSCLLLPLPPSVQRRSYRRPRVTERDHDGPGTGSSVVEASRGRRRRAGGRRFCVKALFGDGGGDWFRAIRRMVKLDSAIQNRSVSELLELVGDECLYFFRNIRSIDLSQMSKDMFLLLHAMMVRHNVSFVLKPTENDAGFDLGIKWSLEWKGKKLPWDLDCNVSTSHVYKGLFLISQVNKTCVPLMQRILQIIQQNLDAVILTIVHKILPQGTLDENTAKTITSCAIIGLAVMVLFYAMFKNL